MKDTSSTYLPFLMTQPSATYHQTRGTGVAAHTVLSRQHRRMGSPQTPACRVSLRETTSPALAHGTCTNNINVTSHAAFLLTAHVGAHSSRGCTQLTWVHTAHVGAHSSCGCTQLTFPAHSSHRKTTYFTYHFHLNFVNPLPNVGLCKTFLSVSVGLSLALFLLLD